MELLRQSFFLFSAPAPPLPPSPPHSFLLPLVSSRPSLLILAPAGDLGGQKEPLRAVSLWLRWTHAQGHGPLWTPAVPHSSWLALSPTCCRQGGMLRRGHLPALPPWQLPSDHSHLPISMSAACPEWFRELSAMHLATHLSLRQPTFFLEPPVGSSQDRCSWDMGSLLRSNSLGATSRWKWGNRVLGAPRWMSPEDPRTPIAGRRHSASPTCLSPWADTFLGVSLPTPAGLPGGWDLVSAAVSPWAALRGFCSLLKMCLIRKVHHTAVRAQLGGVVDERQFLG